MGRKDGKAPSGNGSVAPRSGTITLSGDSKFSGTFPWRVPTLADEIAIGAARAAIAKAQRSEIDDLPSDAAALVRIMAYMRVLSTPPAGQEDERPSWWLASDGGTRLFSSDPMLEYWMEGTARERRFHGRDEDAPAAGGSAGDGSAADDEEGVERAVQAPDERREVIVAHGS